MSKYTFSKNGKFPNGVNISQLEELIKNSNIVCSCLGTTVYDNDVIIGFNDQLSAGEITTLNTIIDTFMPRADVLYSGVKVDTIIYANSPYTIGRNSVSCDTSGGNITIYLKKANRSKNGMHAIEKATSDANTVTIIPNGSDLINGSSSAVISTYRQCLIIQSDGSNWNFTPSATSIIQTENEGAVDITNNKGDLSVDDGTRQQSLSVGSNNQALIADSTATLGIKWATINHTTLSNIGTNTHAQIDSHISTTTAHGVTGDIVGTTNVQSVLNKTMTDNSNNIIARSLWAGSGSGSVSVYAATAPSTGQVLTATNGTTATWQTPAAGGSTDWKDSVRVATTANITLSGTQTIDGVSVVANDRVLVKNQNTSSQNGIYTCASGSWSRATDADSSAEVTSGMTMYVQSGSSNAGTTWQLTTVDPITLGSTGLTFASFQSGGSASGAKDQIQFRGNSPGSFSSDSKFRWDTNTSTFFVGSTTPSGLQGLSMYSSDSQNIWLQNVLQNFSSGTQASTDYVCTNDLGDDSTYYIDLGINSSGYSDPSYALSTANDSYLYCASGKLTVGTYNAYDVVLHTGGLDLTNERLRLIDASDPKNAIIQCSSNLMLFNGSTTNRPTTPQTGMLRYNTTTNLAELYENTSWKSVATHTGSDSYFVLNEKTGSAPSAPSSGTKLFSCVRSGRRSGQVSSSGENYEFQPSLYNRDNMYWNAQGNSATISTIGFGNLATGTATTRNVASTNLFTTMRRIGYVSTATAGSSAGTRHGLQQFWRGNAAGLGGFMYVARFGLSSASAVATQRSFVGLIASTAVLGNADPSSNTAIPLLGFGVDAADSAWSFMHGNGTSITKDTLTGTFPARDRSVSMLEARIYCYANSSTISYSLEVLGGGSIFEGSTTTTLPSTTTFLSPQIWTNNGTTALACGIDVVLQYMETY